MFADGSIYLSKGWLTVLGGFLIHLVLGTLYCWANITSAVTSLIRRTEPDITYNDTIIVYAAALAAQGLTMLAGGLLSQRIGPKNCCFLGSAILVSGTFLASFSTSYIEIVLCQGIMLGLGIGICYTAPISAAVRWMPNRKGLVTGIIVGGFGCGAFIFGFIASYVVNPNRESVNSSGPNTNYFSPDSDVVQRVPLMFLVLTFSYIICLTCGCLLLNEPTHEEIPNYAPLSHESSGAVDSKTPPKNPIRKKSVTKGSYHSTETEDDIEESNAPKKSVELSVTNAIPPLSPTTKTPEVKVHESPPTIDLSPKEVLKNPLAWHIASCLITTAVGGMYLAGTFKTYGQQTIKNEAFLASVSATSSIFNTGGRFFWGWLADQIGPLRALQIMGILFSLTILTYANSVKIGPFGFALWTYLIFFFEGANFVLYVPVTILSFGSKYSASNYGLIFSSYSLFVVLNIYIMAGSQVSFDTASLTMGLLTGLGFLNLLLLEMHIRCSKKQPEEECKFR
jgi:MFS family permease